MRQHRRRSRSRACSLFWQRYGVGFTAIVLLRLGQSAHAQTIPPPAVELRNADQSEYREDASTAADAIFATQEGTTPTAIDLGNLTLQLNQAFTYSGKTNAYQEYGTPSLEVGPEGDVSWSRKMKSIPIQVTASLDLADDDYTGTEFDSGEDETVFAEFVTKYYDASDDQAWQPYADVKNTEIFVPSFSNWNASQNDLSIGVTKNFNFDGSFHRLAAAPHSRRDAVWTFGLKMYGQRRFTSFGARSFAFVIKPEVDYLLTHNLIFSLEVKTTKRWFDGADFGGDIVLRQDVTVDPQLTLSYSPPTWGFEGDRDLQRILGTPDIAIQADFQHANSNIASKSSNKWSIAPSLNATWQF